MFKAVIKAVAVMGVVLAAFAGRAEAGDRMIEESLKCTRQLPIAETRHGIPEYLLSAIAVTETGRYHKGLKMKLPWPWSINANGKGYYLDSKSEAIAKVRQLQRQGIKSIDVGCMQVNLYHHAKAFRSLEEAFNPEHNIQYAAKFLSGHYTESKSWRQSVGWYHSRTPSLAGNYRKLVFANLDSIQGRMSKVYAGKMPNYVRMDDNKPAFIALNDGAKSYRITDELKSRNRNRMLVVRVEKSDTEAKRGVRIIRGGKAELAQASGG